MSNTRNDILDAAFNEFIKNGYEGARMKSITDQTGVTKAMIHYYFNNKRSLFEEVYRSAVSDLLVDLFQVLEEEHTLYKKIETFIRELLERAEQNPARVAFIVEELNKNPNITGPVLHSILSIELDTFEDQLDEAASNYEIIRIDSRQLLINIFSLCLFPYAATTFFNKVLNIDGEQGLNDLLEKRKGQVADIILNSLTS